MIILTKEILENIEQFDSVIENEKALINSKLQQQKVLKELLLDSMQRFADCPNNIDVSCLTSVLNLLEDLKNALNLLKTNISLLESIYNKVLKLNDNKINVTTEYLNTFNNEFFEVENTVLKNTIEVENILKTVLSLSYFTFLDANKSQLQEEEKDKILKMPIDENLIKTIDDTNNVENTLIISEQKGKIFLPYTLSNLKEILINNPNKYSSIEDIIEKDFSLPFDLYRNPAIARFREAFKLVRKRENKSVKEAFDLGMELLFNYNLHPAIITACRNLDELDIYLDYLENNETHKFDCFKIIFDIAPVIVKNKKS